MAEVAGSGDTTIRVAEARHVFRLVLPNGFPDFCFFPRAIRSSCLNDEPAVSIRSSRAKQRDDESLTRVCVSFGGEIGVLSRYKYIYLFPRALKRYNLSNTKTCPRERGGRRWFRFTNMLYLRIQRRHSRATLTVLFALP